MSQAAAWSVVLGVVLGIGLWCIVATLPRLAAPTLADRVAPYIVDVSEAARLHSDRRRSDPLPLLGSLFAPMARSLMAVLGTVTGGSQSIQRRLDQLGSTSTILRFRQEQLLAGLGGAVLGIFAATLAMSNRSVPSIVSVALPVLFAVSGWVLRDMLLQRRARARAARLVAELPTALEFLSLCLSAGEGILDSLRRVARAGSGELSIEFHAVVAEVSTGVPVAAALADRARRADVASFTRAVEQMVVALERGAPLAEVLRAQAQDARDDAKRALLESAGKKEVAMLIPLVFFILPLSVMFAIFPGIFVLQAGF